MQLVEVDVPIVALIDADRDGVVPLGEIRPGTSLNVPVVPVLREAKKDVPRDDTPVDGEGSRRNVSRGVGPPRDEAVVARGVHVDAEGHGVSTLTEVVDESRT